MDNPPIRVRRPRLDRLFWLETRDDAITCLFASFFGLLSAGFSIGVLYFGFYRGEGAQTGACVFFAGLCSTITTRLVLRVINRIRSRFNSLRT